MTRPATPPTRDPSSAASRARGTAPSGETGDTPPVTLRVDQLVVTYRARRRGKHPRAEVRAVDGVNLTIEPREILALVGESGCGKTTIANAVMRLVQPTAGTITLAGISLTALTGRRLRRARRQFQMIFQDPFESLDPRHTAGETVLESLRIHNIGDSNEDRLTKMLAALTDAGLHPADRVAGRYPHQLSGGQRQRVAIAAAMVLEPSLIVADEPVSMLDVSLRAGILRLMLDLRNRCGVSYLFITHDLSLAWTFADRIAVLYLGRIVEHGSARDVIDRPRHPYTRALVSVIPVPEVGERTGRTVLRGETPNPERIPAGCRFHPRCPLYLQLAEPTRCRTDDPTLQPAADNPSHLHACHFADSPRADYDDSNPSPELAGHSSVTDPARRTLPSPAAHGRTLDADQ